LSGLPTGLAHAADGVAFVVVPNDRNRCKNLRRRLQHPPFTGCRGDGIVAS